MLGRAAIESHKKGYCSSNIAGMSTGKCCIQPANRRCGWGVTVMNCNNNSTRICMGKKIMMKKVGTNQISMHACIRDSEISRKRLIAYGVA
jgi:hypothetical protein